MMAQIQQSVLVFSLINPYIKMKKATAHLKELNELNLILTCTAPNVFHQKLLQHDKPQFHPKHMLHMLNQHSICIPQVRLFNFMTPIERYLFSIWNNASMDVPQITLKKTFIRKEINQNIKCPHLFSLLPGRRAGQTSDWQFEVSKQRIRLRRILLRGPLLSWRCATSPDWPRRWPWAKYRTTASLFGRKDGTPYWPRFLCHRLGVGHNCLVYHLRPLL